MKRRWYFLPLAILLVCVVAAFAVRGTYTDISSDIDSCTYAASYDFTKAVETLGESDFSKVPQALYDGADIVVEGTCTGRSITPNAWFESFSVEKVHKGDASLSGQTLQILEELTLFVNVKNINTMMSAYLPLQEGERYLLLLKKADALLIPFSIRNNGVFSVADKDIRALTWHHLIRMTMENAGGQMSLNELYMRLESHPKSKRNPHYRERIRATIYEHTEEYVPVTNGVYRLSYQV